MDELRALRQPEALSYLQVPAATSSEGRHLFYMQSQPRDPL